MKKKKKKSGCQDAGPEKIYYKILTQILEKVGVNRWISFLFRGNSLKG